MAILLLLPALVILLGVGLLMGGNDERKRIAEAVAAPCQQIPAGRDVKLTGTAVANEELIAPLSKVPCVFYRLIFLKWEDEEREQGKKFVEVFRTQAAAPGFAIADATGRMAIDATGADLRVEKAHTGASGLLTATTVDAVVKKHLPGKSGEGRTTVNEVVIPVGAPLIAIGEAIVQKGLTTFGGKHLILSVLPEAKLMQRDRGDALGAALVAAGAVGFVACLYALLRDT